MSTKIKNELMNNSVQTKLHAFAINEELVRQRGISERAKLRRLAAFEIYEKLPVPSKALKGWRKSGLDDFYPEKFWLNYPTALNFKDISKKCTVQFKSNDLAGSIYVTPEKVEFELNEELHKQGVVLCDLRTAENDYPHLIEEIMGKIVFADESKFSALTQAIERDGVFLFIPKGIKVQEPIHSVFYADGSHQLTTFHLLVRLDEGASVTFIQEWIGEGETRAINMHSGVTEIQVKKSANLNFIELQTWSDAWWNFTHARANIMEGGHINWMTYADGSHYSRNFLGVKMTGGDASAEITGMGLCTSDSQIDFDTYQDHLAENTKSDLLFQNALANHGRSVWSGMIKVAPGALKVDGYQANKNLMLCGSPHAESIPGLEILADDVRCSHGVTIGEIAADQVFYLSSRGISEGEAKQLIAEGFMESALSRFPDEKIRGIISARIHSKLTSLFCE